MVKESGRCERFGGVVVGLLLSGALLAGCGWAAQPSHSSATADSPPTSSTTSSPTSSSISGGPTTAVVGFDGVGAVRVGTSVVDAVGAIAPPYSIEPRENCPNPATTILRAETSPTIWVQADAASGLVDVVAVGGDGPGGPRDAGSPRTQAGLGIGSTLDDVQSVYPGGALETYSSGEPDRFVVAGVGNSGDPRYLVFSFLGNNVQTILVQTSPEKVWEFCG